MNSIEILKLLPATLEWIVFFRLKAIQKITDDETIRKMYFLKPDLKISEYSFVILSNNGTLLLNKNGSALVNADTLEIFNHKNIRESIYEKHNELISFTGSADPDCIGLGQMGDSEPVMLELKIEKGIADARAVFDKKPDLKNYELLISAGITFKGGEIIGNKYIAGFENIIPEHIHAGILAHFSRTANCNQFFFNHGNIDEHLEKGLLNTLKNKIISKKEKVKEALIDLAEAALNNNLSLTCIPPKPAEPFSYGNIIPYGFLLKALNPFNSGDTMFANFDLRERIMGYLRSAMQDGLWSYHTNGLITSTDSALVLLGLYKKNSVERLEIFSNGNEEYYPQLFSEVRKKNHMLKDISNAHWCRTDIATSYLIRALKNECGIKRRHDIEYYEKTFSQRSGMFFANPYMTDWFLAMALKGEKNSDVIRNKLKEEILNSINEDFSFGNFDPALSTSLAILALNELGYNNRILSLCQLKLTEFLESDNTFPVSTPFYSTLKTDRSVFTPVKLMQLILGDDNGQIISIEDEYYAVSFYEDTRKIISTSLGFNALSVKTNPEVNDMSQLNNKESKNEMYNCENQSVYIKRISEMNISELQK